MRMIVDQRYRGSIALQIMEQTTAGPHLHVLCRRRPQLALGGVRCCVHMHTIGTTKRNPYGYPGVWPPASLWAPGKPLAAQTQATWKTCPRRLHQQPP